MLCAHKQLDANSNRHYISQALCHSNRHWSRIRELLLATASDVASGSGRYCTSPSSTDHRCDTFLVQLPSMMAGQRHDAYLERPRSMSTSVADLQTCSCSLMLPYRIQGLLDCLISIRLGPSSVQYICQGSAGAPHHNFRDARTSLMIAPDR
jgi:hypothetical protein